MTEHTTEITIGHANAVTPNQPGILAIIDKLANSPALTPDTIETLERLLAMQERVEVQRRKDSFFDALARVQAQMKRIRKDGLMDRGSGGQISYARREDIDAVIRPIYQAEGFSVTWDAPMRDDGKIRVVGRFTAHGHTEQREWTCAPDASGGKQSPQATGSTISYGQRYLSVMFWDIITEDQDTNGAKRDDVTPITQDQADDIRTRMNDLPQSRPGSLLKKLCEKYRVDRPEHLRVSQFEGAIKDVADTERRLNAVRG